MMSSMGGLKESDLGGDAENVSSSHTILAEFSWLLHGWYEIMLVGGRGRGEGVEEGFGMGGREGGAERKVGGGGGGVGLCV